MNFLCTVAICTTLAMGYNQEPAIPYTQEEIQMVADVVMNEASIEPFECKQAVAKVIFNRLEYGGFGSTIEEVINYPGAFCVSNNNGDTTDECLDAVMAALEYPDCFPSDMLYFRLDHYHNFGYDYCFIGRTYFTTQDYDYNNIEEGVYMEEQTLTEFLKEQDPNEVIYIGAKGGSAFIYIAEASKLMEDMDQLDRYILKTAERVLRQAECNRRTLPSRIETNEKLLQEYKDIKGEFGADYKIDGEEDPVGVLYKRIKHDLVIERNALNCANNLHERYTPIVRERRSIGERKVIETYPRHLCGTGTIVLVEGFEAGRLWFKDEVKII